jgi:hypothetical protein
MMNCWCDTNIVERSETVDSSNVSSPPVPLVWRMLNFNTTCIYCILLILSSNGTKWSEAVMNDGFIVGILNSRGVPRPPSF